MPQAIAGVLIKLGVNVIVAQLIATVAVNFLLSRVSRMLAGTKRAFSPDTTQQVTVVDSTAPRMIIYGSVRTSGVMIFYGTPETKGSRLWYTIAIAGHQCDALTDIWFDNIQIPDASIDSGTGAVTSGPYTGAVFVHRKTGTSTQTAISSQVADVEVWDSNHKGIGIAYFSVLLLSDSLRGETVAPVFPNGAPRDFFVQAKGRRVYDPRKDSTNGGSGSHRLTNPSTWEWSDNSALCTADYITGGSQWYDTTTITSRLGMNESTDRVDWAAVITAADVCDQTPSIPGGSEKRYTCNGVLSCGDTHQQNLSKLLGSMAGQCVYTGGKYRIFAGAYDSPAHTITDSDLTGPYQIFTSTPRDQLYNAVSAVYIDPAQNYQSVTAPLRTDATYESDDGERIIRPIDLPMTNSPYTAQRIAELSKRQSRNQITGSIQLGINGFKVKLWETFNLALSECWAGNKVVRCTDWKFIPQSPPQIEITFRLEDSSAYTDLASGAYEVAPSITANPNSSDVPGPATALQSSSQDNAILLIWQPSPTSGVTYELEESTAASMTSPTVVYRGADAQAVIPKAVTTTYYYRVRCKRFGQYSTYEPPANGVAGAAGSITAGFRAAVSPGSVYKYTTSSSATTGSAVASPINGTAPFTYSWARISGDTSITITSSTSASTTFSRTGMSTLTEYTAIFRCTITDNTSATATADVTVTIYRDVP